MAIQDDDMIGTEVDPVEPDEIDALRARVAELEARIAELQPMAQCAAIMAVCGYFSRLRRPDAWLTQWPDGIKSTTRYWPDGRIGSNEDNFSVFPLYAGSAPVPAAQAVDVDAICNAYESGVGHRGRPTANVNPYRECTPEHEAYSIGAKGSAAQAEAKVADDVRLGNRLYVWDYDNPEDGSWDNIEEYLHDTTPGVGDVVRLNLAMPLQDVEVEMLEVGRYGEPIRWQVRDVKTGAMLAAKAKGES